ncbi:hypothetical protein [Cryobacterium soli]|uniref:hypothetical protein n=1 Tax=Cryobacterium soli TaxID=2220095 RepID=UPI0013C40FDF|nr:hypothetical protein [Cryobacterium soli]
MPANRTPHPRNGATPAVGEALVTRRCALGAPPAKRRRTRAPPPAGQVRRIRRLKLAG